MINLLIIILVNLSVLLLFIKQMFPSFYEDRMILFNKIKDTYKIAELIAATILSAILFPLGLIFNVWDLIRFKRRFWKFIFRFIYEIWLIFLDIFEKIAVIIDRIGNVILGNSLTWFFVKREFYNQLYFNPYGKNKWTISGATGYFEIKLLLNNRGLKFSKLLSKVFGDNHCAKAYQFHILKENFNSKTGIS